jgi:DNA-binding CsgD family transcriptional regulator
VATPSTVELVGRDEELAALRAFGAEREPGPAALVLRGEPGIGKTVLWRAGVAAFERGQARVLVARCAEAEMPIPLGALSDLLDAVYDDIRDELAEPQRHALAAALRIESEPSGRPDRLALPRAVLAGLRALAVDAPVLVAIDDLQWLDPTSARVLAFAVRRLGDAPVAFLVTLRGGSDVREPLGLGEAFGESSFEEIALGPLDPDALQRLVRERVGIRIPRSELAAVQAACGGNPMFALEFARTAAAQGVELGALPVPKSLQSLVKDRVNGLPPDARPVLELVSAVERPTVPLLARALGDELAESLVEEAAAAGAITVGDDAVARFTHPLLGSTVYFGMPARRRRELHREVAGLVDDVEQKARHLALATAATDATVADVVEQAVQAAAARGASDAAAVFALETLRLTPRGDESALTQRTFAAAGLLIEAGDVHEARAQVEPLLDPERPPGVRSQALIMRAETEHQDRKLMLSCLREAIGIAPDPRVRVHALLRYAQHGGWVSADAATAVRSAREAYDIALELDDEPLLAASLATLAYYEAGSGRPREVEPDDDALLRAELPRMAAWQITPAVSAGARALWAGDLDRAREILRRERDELIRQGSLVRLPIFVLTYLFDVEWRAGRFEAAEACVEEAQSILDDALPGAAVVLYPQRVLLAGARGGVEEARELAAEGLRLAGLRSDRVNPVRLGSALGHVELMRGDAEAAVHALEPVPAALDAFGIAEPAVYPALPDAVEALVLVGRLDDAEAILRRLEAQAEALRHGWATPVALRCRALTLLARERSEEAAQAAERSAAALGELGFPVDEARALFVAGSAWRRAGQRRRAAGLLARSLDILDALPAPLWQQRVADEMRRAAPRPRRDRELTDTERRVARLVVEGRTNREVAAELFVTVATVEAHLTRIYRKLGIRSRTALAHAVADGAVQLEDGQGK